MSQVKEIDRESTFIIRSILDNAGDDARLRAIKYLRGVHGLCRFRAAQAVEDIANCERWTYPEIKGDLNMWEHIALSTDKYKKRSTVIFNNKGPSHVWDPNMRELVLA